MKKVRNLERGQSMILAALAIIGLVCLTAVSVDGGLAYLDRRSAQNAADAAALAAALTKTRSGDWLNAGLARAASNGHNNDGTTNTVEFHNPPISGPYSGNNEYIQVFITSSVKTYFAPMVGITQVTNKVEAVARAKPGSTEPMFSGDAIVSLDTDDCRAFDAGGNGDLETRGGWIHVRSDCAGSAFRQHGSGSVSSDHPITVVGGATYDPGDVTPPPSTGAAPHPDIIYPNPTCTGNATMIDSDTLGPGTVNGSFPPSGVTNLAPGIYCITGDFEFHGNGELTGSEVVLVLQSGRITLNGTTRIDLSAPTGGPFPGLLIYLPPGNTSTVIIDGTNDSTFTGSILAPSAHIRVNGTGDVDGFNSQIIGNTVEWSGTADGVIRYQDSLNFDAQTPPSVELAR
jgi:hypothetical protein